jgi:hypothetical protein
VKIGHCLVCETPNSKKERKKERKKATELGLRSLRGKAQLLENTLKQLGEDDDDTLLQAYVKKGTNTCWWKNMRTRCSQFTMMDQVAVLQKKLDIYMNKMLWLDQFIWVN